MGSILGSCWDPFGLCLAVRPPNTKTLIFDDPLTRNRVFSGPRGSQNPSKIAPDGLRALSLAPKVSWRPLRLDLGAFWVSFWVPKSLEKRHQKQLIFEWILGARGGAGNPSDGLRGGNRHAFWAGGGRARISNNASWPLGLEANEPFGLWANGQEGFRLEAGGYEARFLRFL